ncbi:glycosyltransferase [Neobacillus muris]|uniref:glycosyltransferase n=1 Tax=Neobacillus muris TaxID=2941334 RepID=UPI00203B480D|nr:glycosyltransferase [Neobacillus muris]
MKTKVVFVTNKMIMGGIEKALISMLEQIPKDRYDVSLFVVHPKGELIDKIPSHVHVKSIFDNRERIASMVWNYTKRGKFLSAFNVILSSVLLKWGSISEFEKFGYYSKIRNIDEAHYDLAISYSSPITLPLVFVANNINAKKKIAWIHNDVSDLANPIHSRLVRKLRKYFEIYDYIFCVSHHAFRKFTGVFQDLPNDISVFYNILDKKKMELMSMEDGSYNDQFKGIRILTVGRLSKEKGQDIIPSVLSKLLSNGYNVRWYCIGEGPIRLQLEENIKEYNLVNNLILLGTKDNPFPYIKECDLYIQPSRHEAYCITVAEARAFCKPIIITNTGASEQIANKKTGLIVGFDDNQIYEAIKRLLDDQLLKEKLIKNLSAETVDTINEMEKFYRIVEKIS